MATNGNRTDTLVNAGVRVVENAVQNRQIRLVEDSVEDGEIRFAQIRLAEYLLEIHRRPCSFNQRKAGVKRPASYPSQTAH